MKQTPTPIRSPAGRVGSCYFCKAPCGPDVFCYGCRQFVCEACSTNPEQPMGGHDVDAHRHEDDL